jgi:hypothetical protein
MGYVMQSGRQVDASYFGKTYGKPGWKIKQRGGFKMRKSRLIKTEPVGRQALQPKDTTMVINIMLPKEAATHQQQNGGVYETLLISIRCGND